MPATRAARPRVDKWTVETRLFFYWAILSAASEGGLAREVVGVKRRGGEPLTGVPTGGLKGAGRECQTFQVMSSSGAKRD